MKLSPADVKTFYEIQSALYSFVNRQRQLFPQFKTREELRDGATLEQLDAIRQVLYDDIRLLDEFVAANPDNLPQGHLEIARTWRHFRAGTFYILRYLKKYTIFLDSGDPPRAYGVLGLHIDFDEILPMRPPIMVEAVLLPFRDRIVFDGILKPYNIYFGGGIKRSLNEAYRLAKERFGIITSLLPGAEEEGIAGANIRVLKAFEKWLFRYGLRPKLWSGMWATCASSPRPSCPAPSSTLRPPMCSITWRKVFPRRRNARTPLSASRSSSSLWEIQGGWTGKQRTRYGRSCGGYK